VAGVAEPIQYATDHEIDCSSTGKARLDEATWNVCCGHPATKEQCLDRASTIRHNPARLLSRLSATLSTTRITPVVKNWRASFMGRCLFVHSTGLSVLSF